MSAPNHSGSMASRSRHGGVAIVGCGFIGRIYAQVLPELGVSVAAVVDPDPEARSGLARQLGCPGYADLTSLLDSGPSVALVGISSPSQFHYPLAIKALNAGLHVLCEKPLALSLAQVREMVELAERSGLKLAVGFKMRFEPVFAEVKRLVAEGVVGQPLRVIVTQHQPTPPQDWVLRYGIANELLIHGLDLANWLIECGPTLGWYRNLGHSATIELRYPGGRDALVTGSWLENFPAVGGHNDTSLQVIGTHGHLLAARPASILINRARGANRVELPASGYEEPFRHEWAAFLGWTDGEEPGELAVGQDAIRVHEVLEKVNDADVRKGSS